MFKNNVSMIIFLILSLYVLQSTIQVEINLSSSLEDISQETYEISNKIVKLISNTDYTIKGTCSECGIEIKKGTSPTVTLNSITIDNSNTGPFVIKKNCDVKLILVGTSKITDKEADETLSDFEGAGIKFKSGSNLTISGTGNLIILGNIKNGVKGASLTNLVINSGNFNITSVNNAIAADGSMIINGGNFNIKTTEGDGIKSDPDADDTESKGTVTINGGIFNINSYGDGIQAKTKLTINDGSFNIKTYTNGASSTGFNKDTQSAKGIKASTNDTSVNIELEINGGNFNLNSRDEAVHSDGNLTITGGNFIISTGDDGIHADHNLILGKKNAKDDLVKINITKSNEGMEGSQVYIYSGTYRIISSDDGINSAGDLTEECRQGSNIPGNFGPGGNNNNNNRPSNGFRNLRGKVRKLQSQCANYHIYIYGGNIYVNSEHDALDANGNIIISGGNIEVWGARANSDGDFVDLDGKMSITGGTIFGGGNAGMINPTGWQNSQGKIYQQGQIGANSVINIMSGSTNIKSYITPKNINYIYYSSSNVDSNYKFSISNTGSNTNTNTNTNPGTPGTPGIPQSNNMPSPSNQGNMPMNRNSSNIPPNQGNMPMNRNSNNIPPNQGNMPFPGNSSNIPPNQGNMHFPGNSSNTPPPNQGNMPTPPSSNNMPGNPGSSNMPIPSNQGNFPQNPGNMPFPGNSSNFPPDQNNMPIPQGSNNMPENPGSNNMPTPPENQGSNNQPMPPNSSNNPGTQGNPNSSNMQNPPQIPGSNTNIGSNNNQAPPNSSNMPAPPNSGNNQATPGSSNMPIPPGSSTNPGTNISPNNPAYNNGVDEDDDDENIRAFINGDINMKMNLIYLMLISALML